MLARRSDLYRARPHIVVSTLAVPQKLAAALYLPGGDVAAPSARSVVIIVRRARALRAHRYVSRGDHQC